MKRSVLLSLIGITLHAFVSLVAVQASSQLRDIPHGGGEFPQKRASPTTSTPSRTWLIRPDGTGDAPTIQAGVDSAAASGDTLLLDDGTFTGPGNHDVRVLKEITIRSRSGPERTVIDCEHVGPAFLFGDWWAGLGVGLEGVTILNGGRESGEDETSNAIFGLYAHLIIDNCVITASAGNGLYLYACTAEIRHSVFEDNRYAGASSYDEYRLVEMTDCTLRNNGSGISGSMSSGCLTRCRIEDNGRAVSIVEGGLTMIDCDVVGNSRGIFTGGAHIVGNRFFGNTGLLLEFDWGVIASVQNNIIARHAGPLLFLGTDDKVEFTGNTIVGTIADAPLFQSDAWLGEANLTLRRNIFAYNTYPKMFATDDKTEVVLAHNDVFANTGETLTSEVSTNGNFSSDPWFCNRFEDRYTLQDGSPCLPENNESGELIGALGEGCRALELGMNITPSVLGGRLQGPLKATVTLDDGIEDADVNLATVRLEGVLEPEATESPGGGNKQKTTIEFQKTDVLDVLLPVTPGQSRRLWLTAQASDGRPLRASGELQISHIEGIKDPGPNEEGDFEALAAPLITPGIASVTPNPFNPTTRIRFGMTRPGPVDLAVYDVAGRLVERLVHETLPAGDHDVTWSANGVASGVYFARLTTPEGTYKTKLVVMK